MILKHRTVDEAYVKA
jgi:hypothetical protein